jgi:hypothetical protein
MDGQQEEPVLPPETVAQRMSRPIYFPVSPLKLVVLATCTFGLYEIYWFYRHWGVVRERHNSGIVPFARAFFAPLFCYSLFKVPTSASTNKGPPITTPAMFHPENLLLVS